MNNLLISPDYTISRHEGQISSKLDGDVVLLSIEQGEYYQMDTIGSRIWDLIEKPMLFKDLCEQLTREFDVDMAQCQEDVSSFLGELTDKSLIKCWQSE